MKRIFAVLSLIVVLTMPGFSQNKDDGDKSSRITNVERFNKALDLDEGQSEKIKTIMNESTKEINLKKIDIRRLNLDIKEELMADKPDLNRIKELAEKKSVLQGETEFILIKRDLDIKALLTPEQLSKWKSFIRMKQRNPKKTGLGKGK